MEMTCTEMKHVANERPQRNEHKRPRLDASRGMECHEKIGVDEPEHRNTHDQHRIGFQRLHELRDREPNELLNYHNNSEERVSRGIGQMIICTTSQVAWEKFWRL